jgi:AbrB family looped-hinge helix DNA binding protein
MLTSKLTSKYQATIPKEVRRALHLEAKDRILYLIQDDNTVKITRMSPLDLDYLKSLSTTLSEWESEEDERAFRNL